MKKIDRRDFFKYTAAVAAGAGVLQAPVAGAAHICRTQALNSGVNIRCCRASCPTRKNLSWRYGADTEG
jgi:anaerobic selenocysteine-containing dehydrogenase